MCYEKEIFLENIFYNNEYLLKSHFNFTRSFIFAIILIIQHIGWIHLYINMHIKSPIGNNEKIWTIFGFWTLYKRI